MYIVNREDLQVRLKYFNRLIAFFSTEEPDLMIKQNFAEKLAFERAYLLVIESMLDISYLIIDSFMMRDPACFADVFSVLEEEGVISTSAKCVYIELLNKRTTLIKDYLHVNHGLLLKVYKENLHEIQRFSADIIAYIETETEVVLHNIQ